MVNLAKISIFALVGLMAAVVFVPSIRETITRLFTPSETIFVPLDGVILGKDHYIQVNQETESDSGSVILVAHFENPS